MVTRTGPIVVTRTGKVHKGERSSRAFFRFDLDLDRHETSASASSIFRSPIQAAPGESITGYWKHNRREDGGPGPPEDLCKHPTARDGADYDKNRYSLRGRRGLPPLDAVLVCGHSDLRCRCHSDGRWCHSDESM